MNITTKNFSHRPKSALERGGTRPPTRAASVAAIEETDENAPEPEPEPVKEEPKVRTPEPPEEPKPEVNNIKFARFLVTTLNMPKVKHQMHGF